MAHEQVRALGSAPVVGDEMQRRGEQVRVRRERLRLHQREVAAAAGISLRTMQYVEAGRSGPRTLRYAEEALDELEASAGRRAELRVVGERREGQTVVARDVEVEVEPGWVVRIQLRGSTPTDPESVERMMRAISRADRIRDQAGQIGPDRDNRG